MTAEQGSNNNLSSEQRNALQASTTSHAPPVDLEARLLREMRRRGLVAQTSSPRYWQVAVGIAAAVLLVFLGLHWRLSSKQAVATVAKDTRPQFMLLLYEDSKTWKGASEDPAKLVQEYGAWARMLAEQGHLRTAEELSTSGRTLTASTTDKPIPASETDGKLDGFFLISAQNEDDAIHIASTCPHLRYGGRIVVQRVMT